MLDYYWQRRLFPMDLTHLLKIAFHLVLWLILGYVWASIMWDHLEKRFSK